MKEIILLIALLGMLLAGCLYAVYGTFDKCPECGHSLTASATPGNKFCTSCNYTNIKTEIIRGAHESQVEENESTASHEEYETEAVESFR